MAKAKSGAPNKNLHSRVSYLYQAAAYLASQKPQSEPQKDPESGEPLTASRKSTDVSTKAHQAAARHLVKDLRAVSQKSQMRISPAMKHSMCKSCDTMLVEGSTCISEVENRSKGVKKPWADTLVLKCTVCGSARRFPLGAERQKRRPHRTAEKLDAEEVKGD
jgi:ribonuclease P protein subunit RPR2